MQKVTVQEQLRLAVVVFAVSVGQAVAVQPVASAVAPSAVAAFVLLTVVGFAVQKVIA